MHGQLEEFLIVLTVVPSVLVHFLAEVVECVGKQGVRVGIGELEAFLLGKIFQLLADFSGHTSALAENHAPHGIVHHDETALALFESKEVHQGDVLGILREGRHQWRVADARPNVCYLVEQLDEHIVYGKLRLAFLPAEIVDCRADAAEVGHHRSHHAARQTAGKQQRAHVLVLWVDEVAEPLIDELLGHGACLHVGVHVDVRNVEAGILQHALYGDDVRMDLAP